MSELYYWLWLTLKKGITSRKITALLEVFQSPEDIYGADQAAFTEVLGLTRADISALSDKSMSSVASTLETCRKKHIRILTFDSPYYPRLLADIYDPPYVLYARYKERIDLNEHIPISVVGTRSCSAYAVRMAEQMAYDLAQEGVTVVSGMARGIDGAALTGALRGGGQTVAVLGCGVDVCYPTVHKALMEQIIEHGMVLSEYPPGTPPYASHFKVRNRIITGLSYGTVVAEAPERSGALNSASWALEQGRDLFVLPGDVTRINAQGSNNLIAEGAQPIRNAEDILGTYKERFSNVLAEHRPSTDAIRATIPHYGGMTARTNKWQRAPKQAQIAEVPKPVQKVATTTQAMPKQKPANLSPAEESVLALLSDRPVHVDRLVEQGIPAAQLASTLTMLELKGLVQALPGRNYLRRS